MAGQGHCMSARDKGCTHLQAEPSLMGTRKLLPWATWAPGSLHSLEPVLSDEKPL